MLIRLDDGTPLLIESHAGRGRVLLFTSSLDREWNDLPVQPVFVPFVAGSRTTCSAGRVHERGRARQHARGPGARARGRADLRSARPEGAGPRRGSEDVLLDQIGFYEVVGGGTSELVAVNFDPRESDLTPMDAATLDALAGPRRGRPTQARAGARRRRFERTPCRGRSGLGS